MSRITGLPILAPLEKQMVSRSQIEAYLKENLRQEYTPRELHIQQATLEAFGFVSHDFDLEKFLIRFYTEQAAGFYDPRRKTMFIADWVDPAVQETVLAHELTHALQDQNFDMERFLHARRDDDDATAARQAVVEGYATAAMMQHMMGGTPLGSLPSLTPLLDQVMHQQFEEFPVFNQAPFFFRYQALFPYSAGLGFVQHGLAQGGWQKVNQVFDFPPQTTKEIFQPELYFEHRTLPPVALPRPAPLADVPRLKRLDENSLGQLGYYALLGQLISESEAQSEARNWLGDRYLLYEDSATHRYTLVARARWTTTESALAFFRDYHTILIKKFPALLPAPSAGESVFIGSTPSGSVILVRRGHECLWAEGVPSGREPSMLAFLKSL